MNRFYCEAYAHGVTVFDRERDINDGFIHSVDEAKAECEKYNARPELFDAARVRSGMAEG